jgi:hypothetical protein
MNITEEIRKAVKAIFRQGDVVEVRAFGADGSKRVGRYPLGWDLVRAIEAEDLAGRDAYYVLNPTGLPPMPMADGGLGSKNEDIPRRRHFLLDFDPIRKHKIATEDQYQAALLQARQARGLMEHEWARIPIAATSGNGVHLLVSVDLSNDETSKELIKKTQTAISKKFSTPDVTIDVFPDAARLVRAYGSLNRKGQETETLKWRRSHIL